MRRNQHIQSCVRWEMAHGFCQLQSDVYYCYLCFDWIIGDQWASHCQSHLDGCMTKRCGSITSCYTLVRPAYCPFCMGEPNLPAPKRLESWTRDRKLWDHIQQHLAECQWPRMCPHPLCDVILKDSPAFQFHLVDNHGLTHPGETVARGSSESNDAASINEPPSSIDTPRKRKKVGGASPLEWMPPQSFPNAVTADAEPPPHRPSKRPKHGTPTVSPAALSLDHGMFEPHTTAETTRSPVFCPASSSRTSDDEFTLDAVFSEADVCHTNGGVAHTVEEEDLDGDSEFNAMFDQYLRSPTSSPSPANSASGLSGTTLAGSEARSSSSLTTVSKRSGEIQETGQGKPCGNKNPPRIRLQVRQPRITLSLKLPRQAEDARPPSTKVHQARKKQRVRKQGPPRGSKNYQRRRNGQRG